MTKRIPPEQRKLNPLWTEEDCEIVVFLRGELDLTAWVIAAIVDRSIQATEEKIKMLGVRRTERRSRYICFGRMGRNNSPPMALRRLQH